MKIFLKTLNILLIIVIIILLLLFGDHSPKPEKEYRFLVCVSSFKRPIFLSGQIFRFMNQTYPYFDMSVSVKGVPPQIVLNTFMKEWIPFIQQGKLKIRFDENRDQFNNFLDTVRDVDLSKYDYFCKVDDDDWYAPEYLEKVNLALNQEDDIKISHSKKALILTENDATTVFSKNNVLLSGPTMCFSRDVIEDLLFLEKNPKEIDKRGYRPYLYRREDNLFHQIARKKGKQQYRQDEFQVIYGWQYHSVMRPKKKKDEN